MMSEKRFTVESTMVRECILDNVSGEQLDTFDYTERLCELLNEQQATIKQQEQSITILKQEIADAQAILEMLSEKFKGWNNE